MDGIKGSFIVAFGESVRENGQNSEKNREVSAKPLESEGNCGK